MAGFNYYASPYNDPRAIAFRKKYRNAPMGQDFMFENQPYARPGPPGLLAEEGAGTATGYRPMERINPNNRAFMTKEMTERLSSADINRKRYGGGPDVKFMREGAHVTPSGYVDPTQRSLQWVDPTGPITQSPHGLDTLEQEGINARHTSGPYNPPRFPAANQMGPRQIHHAPPSSVTGRGQKSGGQGLLGASPGLEGTDKSGWMRDKRFRDANNRYRLASLLLNYGSNAQQDDGWWTV